MDFKTRDKESFKFWISTWETEKSNAKSWKPCDFVLPWIVLCQLSLNRHDSKYEPFLEILQSRSLWNFSRPLKFCHAAANPTSQSATSTLTVTMSFNHKILRREKVLKTRGRIEIKPRWSIPITQNPMIPISPKGKGLMATNLKLFTFIPLFKQNSLYLMNRMFVI